MQCWIYSFNNISLCNLTSCCSWNIGQNIWYSVLVVGVFSCKYTWLSMSAMYISILDNTELSVCISAALKAFSEVTLVHYKLVCCKLELMACGLYAPLSIHDHEYTDGSVHKQTLWRGTLFWFVHSSVLLWSRTVRQKQLAVHFVKI